MLRNHIKGLIYGQALGDAVGLLTEFKFKRDKPSVQFPYTESVRGWSPCDWTDDTDQMILIMDTLVASNSDFKTSFVRHDDYLEFAKSLVRWKETGFGELGDTVGMGLGGSTNMVLTHASFLTNPFQASEEIWLNSGKKLAPNGAVMRTSILGVLGLFGNDTKLFLDTVRSFCQITHYDARTIMSCWSVCLIVRGILKLVMSESMKELPSLKSRVVELVVSNLDTIQQNMPAVEPVKGLRHQPTPKMYLNELYAKDGHYDVEREYIDYCTASLKDLQLDELGRMGYTFKCMGCAMWALDIVSKYQERSDQSDKVGSVGSLSFEKIIVALVKECGDADTNAAVAGSIVGVYLGYDALPQEWCDALPNRTWLDNRIEKLFQKMNI